MFVILVWLTSYLLAKVEINLEGADGYAKNLPVEWRTNNKWLRSLIGGTSYHLYMGLFLLVFLHSVVIILDAWTLRAEFLILSYLAFVTVAEDFMWFLFNPAKDDKTGKRIYGIQNFKQERIPWFKDRWFLCCPAWYWWYLPIGGLLYWLGGINAV